MPTASNPAATTMEALNTRKIQMQVAAVARPHHQLARYTPFNTTDLCACKQLIKNRKILSNSIIGRVSGVRVPPSLPFFSNTY